MHTRNFRHDDITSNVRKRMTTMFDIRTYHFLYPLQRDNRNAHARLMRYLLYMCKQTQLTIRDTSAIDLVPRLLGNRVSRPPSCSPVLLPDVVVRAGCEGANGGRRRALRVE